jgi:hypothetical protein
MHRAVYPLLALTVLTLPILTLHYFRKPLRIRSLLPQYLLSLLSLLSYLQLLTSSPSTPPPPPQHPPCLKCKLPKPRLFHHCRRCHCCLFRQDHHCMWINGCIAWANLREYVRCLVWAVGSKLAVAFACLGAVAKVGVGVGAAAGLVLGVVVEVGVAWRLAVLLMDQYYNVCSNQTTIETYKDTRGRPRPFH